MSKTTLIVGGIIAVVVILFLVSRSQSQTTTLVPLNATATQLRGGTLGEVLDSTQVGVNAISQLAGAFGSGSSGSNDPGLEDYSY